MSNRFTGLRAKKPYKFIGLDIEIQKLSVANVQTIQDVAKEVEKDSDNSESNLKLLVTVIRLGVPEMSEMTDEEIFNLPMEELSALSAEITKYSGLGK